jgi:hypothetical protein
VAGVAIDVSDTLVVELAGTTRGTVIDVTLEAGTLLSARTAAASARFRSEPGRLIIEMLSPDTVRVHVPSSARRVDIVSGGRMLLQYAGGDVRTRVPRAASGAWRIPLD